MYIYLSFLLNTHHRYFEFNYPPTVREVSKKTHGLIPVWGFADVIESTHSGIQVGERVYGYFAPTRYLLLPVSPDDINKYYFCKSLYYNSVYQLTS